MAPSSQRAGPNSSIEHWLLSIGYWLFSARRSVLQRSEVSFFVIASDRRRPVWTCLRRGSTLYSGRNQSRGRMDAFLVYLICFGVGLCFTIVSAALGHLFGHGADAHGDIGTGGHAEAGFEH